MTALLYRNFLMDRDYVTFIVETPSGLATSLAQNREVNIAEYLGVWVLRPEDLVSNPGYGIQSKTLYTSEPRVTENGDNPQSYWED